MEINVLQDTSKKLVFELNGAGHTLCNVLKKELWSVSGVKVATYSIAHPLKGVPKMTVETDGTLAPRAAIKQAIKNLSSLSQKFGEQVAKL